MDARRFLTAFFLAAALITGGLMAALIAIDPYDRGHGWFGKAGTVERGPRTANVSRGRDPAFNAAIIGNSHVQLLKPERLDAQTGLRFVQLSVPATRPKEQFVLLDWFSRHHQGRFDGLVLGTDMFWCTPDPKYPNEMPFPFWLYDPDPVAYFSNLFRMKAVQVLPRRAAMLAGRGKRQPADGFWNYEALRQRDEAFFRKDVERMRRHGFVWRNTAFPAVEALGSALGRLPASVPVVLLVPPVFVEALPPEGSPERASERACVAALRQVAAARPRTVVVDARVVDARTADAANFWDASHYTRRFAEWIEQEMAPHLRK